MVSQVSTTEQSAHPRKGPTVFGTLGWGATGAALGYVPTALLTSGFAKGAKADLALVKDEFVNSKVAAITADSLTAAEKNCYDTIDDALREAKNAAKTCAGLEFDAMQSNAKDVLKVLKWSKIKAALIPAAIFSAGYLLIKSILASRSADKTN